MGLRSRSEDGACLPCTLSYSAAGPGWKRESRSGSQTQLEGNCRGDVVLNCCQGGGGVCDRGQGKGKANSIVPGLLVFIFQWKAVGKGMDKGGMTIVTILVAGAVTQRATLTLCRVLPVMQGN